VKKPQTNQAFIDGTNLHLTMVNIGWQLDYSKFRIYLSEHYGVGKAYYFIGYVPDNADLYTSLQSYGYILIFKPTLEIKGGKIKGNCDAEMVLQAMIELHHYEKAVLVTSDGDFACLAKYLNSIDKLRCVLAPCKTGCSHLLKKAAGSKIAFMDNLRKSLEYKTKKTL
jgi:uncharacterized LabA/DUF88 family protein